jgi:hypothetical protein
MEKKIYLYILASLWRKPGQLSNRLNFWHTREVFHTPRLDAHAARPPGFQTFNG